MNQSKYGSRKFIITLIALIGSFIISAIGKMTPELAGVVTVSIMAYNIVNGYISKKVEDDK